ncbi:galactose oxidase [Lewinella sp. 4G2]|uniref:Kelch repeat-containing protein n=1 Tax=Lewinella sp. 4G2 TaxID=1803372 RepID=UPI0007B48498|nr:galactose oxidase [Lewinella sp. 4G2]OAV44633.1 galactose oxidase [Lewinella sp. 4G2]
MKTILYLLPFLLLVACQDATAPSEDDLPQVEKEIESGWREVTPADGSAPTARHEAAFIRVGDKAYLLGGRGIKPVDILDLETMTWTAGAESPVEIHHFQPVVYRDEIYLMGAMTGGYPGETPLPEIHIYSPAKDAWRTGATIPEGRRRGGAGAVLHDEKIYLVCGIVDGHRGGHVTWLDAYDPRTDTWTQLPDAPRPRDHFQAVSHENKLYAVAGRTTVAATNPFANTIGQVDVYDVPSQTWSTLTDTLPTHRAGNAALVLNDDLYVLGGESTAHEVAHSEVEVRGLPDGTWRALDSLSRGRHGTGVVHHGGQLIMASGCGNRGGSPELADIIAVALKK